MISRLQKGWFLFIFAVQAEYPLHKFEKAGGFMHINCKKRRGRKNSGFTFVSKISIFNEKTM